MNYDQITCGQNGGNTGLQNCAENFGTINKIIIGPAGTQFTTMASALVNADWVTKCNLGTGERIYPFPGIFNIEADQEAPVKEAGINGKQDFVREGRTRLTLTLDQISHYNFKQLRKHNGKQGLVVYLCTTGGYIQGYSDDDQIFKPFTLSEFRVETKTIASGETISRGRVYMEFEDETQWNDRGVWVKPTTWNPNTDILGIKDVNLSGGTISVAGIAGVSVKGASDGVAVTDLVAGDFVLVDDAGGAETITGITETSDGVYTIAATIAADGYILNLKQQPDMTTVGFESTGSVSYTLS